eukprot:Clim_evm39s215 gene=Clim_evmTU39s215
MAFAISTQGQRWFFPIFKDGEATINDLRTKANEEGAKGRDGALSIEEELDVQVALELSLQEIMSASRVPPKVWATAHSFLKRYLLHRSFNDLPKGVTPGVLLINAAFAATKADGVFFRASDFMNLALRINSAAVVYPDSCKITGQRDAKIVGEAVVGFEVEFLDSINYDLAVHSPFRVLTGLEVEIVAQLREQTGHDLSENQLKKVMPALMKEASRTMRRLLLTDAPLILTPSQLGVAALMLAWDKEKGNESLGSAAEPLIVPVLMGKKGVTKGLNHSHEEEGTMRLLEILKEKCQGMNEAAQERLGRLITASSTEKGAIVPATDIIDRVLVLNGQHTDAMQT